MTPWRHRLGIVLSLVVLSSAPHALAGHEKAVRHYTKGILLLTEEKYRDAVKELRRAVHEDFKFADAHAKLAEAYSSLGTIEGRRQAVEEYRTAIRYDPDNADYYLALGKVHVAQTFDRYAQECFRKCIEIDPNKGEAYLQRGLVYTRRWLTWRQYQDDLERAFDSFLEAYNRGSTERDLLYHLGRVAIEREELDLAMEVLGLVLERDPGDTDARLLYALALQEKGNLKEAEEAYLTAISQTNLQEKVLFLGIDGVASHGLLKMLGGMNVGEAADLARRYWREHDPYLATRLNERLLEHWRRILKADLYFSAPRIGLLGRHSARGKTYIRYGPPTQFEAYIDEDIRPVEVWAYEAGGRHFRLKFRDRFLNGEFGFPFDPRGGPAEHFQALMRQFPEFYLPEYEGDQIRLIADACSFSGTEGRTKQEIYYATPGRELAFRKGERGWYGEFTKRIVVYDQDWHIVAEESTTVTTQTSGALELLRERTLVDQSHFELKPGRYLAAISIEDTLANVMGLTEVGFVARSFDWPGLALSDIEIARSIQPSVGPSPFTKGRLRVEPEPSHRFGRSRPVSFYYEIYRLALDETRQSRFDVTVRVIPLEVEEPKGFWDGVRRLFGGKARTPPHIASTFSYVREAGTLRQHLSLDLTPLRLGRYRLTVSVEDLVAETTASTSTTLWITR